MSFLVYKSSAGSGKTFILVLEYLCVLLQNDDPNYFKRILAITFTNNATNEMKERVLKALESIIYSENINKDDFVIKILEKLKIEKYNEQEFKKIKEKSKQIYQYILHNYSDFSICTIDSFTSKVIRSFAIDLNMPLQFDVNLDYDTTISNVVNIVVNKASDSQKYKEITDSLRVLMNKNFEDSNLGKWKIKDDLVLVSNNLFKEKYYKYIDSFKNIEINEITKFKENLNIRILKFENKWEKIANDSIKLIESKNLESSAFYQTNKGIFGYFMKIKLGNFELDGNSYVKSTIEGNKWYSNKKDFKNQIDEIKEELKNNAELLLAETQFLGEYELLKNIKNELYSLTLLNEIFVELERYKKENQSYTLSDFNLKILKIVLKQNVPFIYEKIGERYNHYLIDEFQDTSSVQWLNLMPLITNSLSTGQNNITNFNMIVGDAKQSIYRFREGNVEQFINLPNFYDKNYDISFENKKEFENILERNLILKNLDTNYRSARQIIEFNNMFFKNFVDEIKIKTIQNAYDKIEQKVAEKNDLKNGFVQIKIDEKLPSDEFIQNNLDYCRATIKKCVEQGYAYKDICILIKNKKEGTLIANDLLKKEDKITIVSNESLKIKTNKYVQLLIAICYYINNDNDLLYNARVIVALQKCDLTDILITADESHEILNKISQRKKNVYDYFKQKGIQKIIDSFRQKNLYEACQSTAQILKIKTDDAYVNAFLEIVYDYTLSKNMLISRFIDYWEKKSENIYIQNPKRGNAIQIMTIHKSKGLQFPVVIMPFLKWASKSYSNYDWIEIPEEIRKESKIQYGRVKLNKNSKHKLIKQLAEEEENNKMLDLINILYVGFTRPEDRLYVYSSFEQRKNFKSDIIKTILDKNDFQENYNTNIGLFEMGTESFVKKEKSIDKEDDLIQLEHMETFIDSKKIKMVLNHSWHDDKLDDTLNKRQFGTFLHNILSVSKTVEEAKNKILFLEAEGWIDDETKIELESIVINIFSNSRLKQYFLTPNKTYSEREILLESGSIIRPDKVVVGKDKVTIIDFKTGLENETHKKQIINYADAIQKIYPTKEIEGLLVYTHSKINIVNV